MTVVRGHRESTLTLQAGARAAACLSMLRRVAKLAVVVLGLFAGPAIAAITFVQQQFCDAAIGTSRQYR